MGTTDFRKHGQSIKDGPSPHAWGQQRHRLALVTRIGPSPHAWGQLVNDCISRSRAPDHPHTRGDNQGEQVSALPLCGPSPHAWGQRSPMAEGTRERRTIPTRVGTTLNSQRLTYGNQGKLEFSVPAASITSSHFSATIQRPSTSMPLRSVGRWFRFCNPGSWDSW